MAVVTHKKPLSTALSQLIKVGQCLDQLYYCFGLGPKVMVGASYAQTVVKLIAGVSINSRSVFFPLHTMGLINGSLSPINFSRGEMSLTLRPDHEKVRSYTPPRRRTSPYVKSNEKCLSELNFEVLPHRPYSLDISVLAAFSCGHNFQWYRWGKKLPEWLFLRQNLWIFITTAGIN